MSSLSCYYVSLRGFFPTFILPLWTRLLFKFGRFTDTPLLGRATDLKREADSLEVDTTIMFDGARVS